MSTPRRTVHERFLARGVTGPVAECWPWPGTRTSAGYGQIRAGGKGEGWLYVHRVAWEIVYPVPIPEGMVVRHLCDNPPCVNPLHLTVGTMRDNSMDMVRRGRAPRGWASGDELHPRRRLSDTEVCESRSRHQAGEPVEGLAREYGCHPETLRRWWRRLT